MKTAQIVSLALLTVILTGCVNIGLKSKCSPLKEDITAAPEMRAIYTKRPVEVDGKLDEQAWETAPVYKMYLPNDRLEEGKTLDEDAEVKLLWDKKYLYVGVTFEDSDIKATGLENNMHHYKYGDVCEVFLRPVGEAHYWELYVTPQSKKTAFFIPMRGPEEIPIDDEFSRHMKVAAVNYGTLNNEQDRDYYWKAEMAVPISQLKKYCDKFGPGHPWRILVARYNYSRYLPEYNPELSTTVRLPKTRYHLLENHAVLKLEK